MRRVLVVGALALALGCNTTQSNPPVQLVFVTQPTTVVAGAAFAVEVDLHDKDGNLVQEASGTVTLSPPTTSTDTIDGTVHVDGTGGRANFVNLRLHKADPALVLRASAGGLTGNSAPFSVTAAEPDHDHCSISVAGSPTPADGVSAAKVTVLLADAFGNPVTGRTVTFSGNLGTQTTGADGSAQVSVTSTTITTIVVSADFGAPFKLSVPVIFFDHKPVGGHSVLAAKAQAVADGVDSIDLVATIVDGSGNPVPGAAIVFSTDVAGDAISGDATTGTDGVAKGKIKSTHAGLRAITAKVGGASGFTLTADATFIPGPPAALAFAIQPSAGVAGKPVNLSVEVDDANGNRTDSTAPIALAIATGPSGASITAGAGNAAAGVAALAPSFDKPGTYTLLASSGSLTSATSASFPIAAGAATRLVFLVAPAGGVAGAPISPGVTVAAVDPLGNQVPISGAVTLGIASGPSGAQVTGGTATASGGVATFAGLSLATAGSYRLTAGASAISPVTSAPFTIVAGAPAGLAFVQQPTRVVAGSPFATTVSVAVLDAFGNVAASTSTVSLSVATGPAGATVTAPDAAAVAGLAAFPALRLTTAGLYTLGASATGLTGATSAQFQVDAGVAAALAFVQQPSDVVAGAAISPAVSVAIVDAFGNQVIGATSPIALSVHTGPGTVTSGGSALAVSSLARFPALTLQAAGSYTLTAQSNALSPATSAAFTVRAGNASGLVFVQQPSDSVAGTAIAPPVVVQAIDRLGNLVSSVTESITITGVPGNAATTPAVAGVAVFTGYAPTAAGTWTLLAATPSGLVSPASNPFTVSPGPFTAVAFSQQPGAAPAGSNLAPEPGVLLLDAFGNTVPTTGLAINAAIFSGPSGANLGGTTGVTSSNGVAAWTDLKLDLVGRYQLLVTAGSKQVSSNSFDISTGAPASLAFVQQPSAVVAGVVMAPSITVALLDAHGNHLNSSPNPITLSVATGPGPIGGGSVAQVTGGLASFGALTLQTAGSYTLTATANGVTPATSGPFTVNPGAAARLAFTTQPPATVTAGAGFATTVSVQDGFGNLIVGSTAGVTLTAAPGTLGGTTALSASGGAAPFSGLLLTAAGSGITLTAAATGLASATSDPIKVVAGPASKLAFTTAPPASVIAGAAFAAAVTVQDFFGNPIGSSVASIGLATNLGALGGGAAKAAVSGVAGFTGLALTTAGSATLTASASGLTSATAPVAVTPAAAAKLAFTSQPPASVAAGSGFAATVAVEDAFGNTVGGTAGNVTLAPSSGTLGGTAALPAAAGSVAFSGLTLQLAGSYTLVASAAGLASATSAGFSVVAGTASKLVFSAQPPASVTAGAGFGATVTVQDAFGNPLGASGVSVSLVSAPVGLAGAAPITAANGSAAFSGLSLQVAGSYTLTASGGGLTPATSALFAVVAGTPSKLAFSLQPPSSVVAGAGFGATVVVQDGFGNTVTTSTAAVSLAPSAGTLLGSTARPASSGLAAFSSLALQTVGSYTLAASATGLAGATSAAINVTPAAAAKLSFSSQPPSQVTAGQPFGAGVSVLDAFGNTVPGSGAQITLASSPGTLGGGGALGAPSGVAIFLALNLSLAGSYTLQAAATGLAGATSAAFSVVAGTAASIAFSAAPPATVTAGQPFAATVAIKDGLGNVVTTSAASVSLAASCGAVGGGAPLSAVAGLAGFTGLSVTLAGPCTLTASSSGLGTAAASFTVVPGVANKLAFTAAPSGNVVAGAGFAAAVTVQDAFGNTASNSTAGVFVAASSGSLGGISNQAAVASVASFSGLTLQVAGSYTLSATSSGLTSATSGPFTIVADVASRLAFTTQPPSTPIVAGTSFSAAVSVQDRFGNTVAAPSVNVALTPSGAVLFGGGAIASSAGVAGFAALSMTAAGSYALTASALTSGITAATSRSFSIVADQPFQLAFKTAPPATVIAGAPFAAAVAVQDRFSNTVLTSTATISLTPGGEPPGPLFGTTSAAAVAGVASFTGLSLKAAGSYSLRTANGLNLVDTSAGVNVVPAAAAALSFTAPGSAQPPASVTAGVPFSAIVSVVDAFGNTVTTSTAGVTLAASTGTLGGTTAGAAAGGAAAFGNLSLTAAGTVTLLASSPGLAGATSSPVTVGAAAASRLAFSTQPPRSVIAHQGFGAAVTFLDPFGNLVTGATAQVSLASNPAGLANGDGVNATLGVASFSGLALDNAGTYTLIASSAGLPAATSRSIAVVPAAPTHLVFTAAPSGAITAGAPFGAVVSVRDDFENVVTTSTTVTLSSSPGDAPDPLTGITIAQTVGGAASFSGLTLQPVGIYTLIASATGLTPATSAAFSIVPGAPARLHFFSQPQVEKPSGLTVSAGEVFFASVEVLDAFGNHVSNPSTSVTLNSTPGGLVGGGAQTTVAGPPDLAFFNALLLRTVGVYTLTASSPGLIGDSSDPVTVVAGPAAALSFSTQPPATVVANTDFGAVVSVKDAFGNLVTSVPSAITLTDSSGTLGGNLSPTYSANSAAFAGLRLTQARAYTLTATMAGAPSTVSNAFNVVAAAASRLAFSLQPPESVVAGASFSASVALLDAYNNVVPSSAPIGLTAPGTTLGGGAPRAAVAGVATFDGLTLTQVTGEEESVQLSATSAGLGPVLSGRIVVTPGPATKLVFTAQPPLQIPAGYSGGEAGAFFSVEVSLYDAFDNLAIDSAASISVTTGDSEVGLGGSSGTSGGRATIPVSGGASTVAGTYALTASTGSFPGATALSHTFDILAGPDDHLVFVVQPPPEFAAGTGFSATIAVRDSFENLATQSTASVGLGLGCDTSVELQGGFPALTPTGGLISFNQLKIFQVITCTLVTEAEQFGGVRSTTFTVDPGAPAQLVYLDPAPPATVTQGLPFRALIGVNDAFGNPTTYSGGVTLTLAPAAGGLSGAGTFPDLANGSADFKALSVAIPGNYALIANAGPLGPAVSPLKVRKILAPSPVLLTAAAPLERATLDPTVPAFLPAPAQPPLLPSGSGGPVGGSGVSAGGEVPPVADAGTPQFIDDELTQQFIESSEDSIPLNLQAGFPVDATGGTCKLVVTDGGPSDGGIENTGCPVLSAPFDTEGFSITRGTVTGESFAAAVTSTGGSTVQPDDTALSNSLTTRLISARQISNIANGWTSEEAYRFTPYAGLLFFEAHSPSARNSSTSKVWRFDPNAAPSAALTQLPDTNPFGSDQLRGPLVVNNALYYVSLDAGNIARLYRWCEASAGCGTGGLTLASAAAPYVPYISPLTRAYNNSIFVHGFTNDSASGTAWWKYDTTADTWTSIVVPGAPVTAPQEVTLVNGAFFFSNKAADGFYRTFTYCETGPACSSPGLVQQLPSTCESCDDNGSQFVGGFPYDGNAAPSVTFYLSTPGPGLPRVMYFYSIAFGFNRICSATEAGDGVQPSLLTWYGADMVMRALDSGGADHLFACGPSDGFTLHSVGATNAGSPDNVHDLALANNAVYFTASSPSGSQLFFYCDPNFYPCDAGALGQVGGSGLLGNPSFAATADHNPQSPLFFQGETSAGGKLFAVGASQVAVEVADITPGRSDNPLAYEGSIAALGSFVYFGANSVLGVQKVFRSGGNGASQAFDVMAQPFNRFSDEIASPIVYNDRLYFAASNGYTLQSPGITKLHRYDGTTITQVLDAQPGGPGGRPDVFSSPAVFQDTLYFAGTAADGTTRLMAYCDGAAGCGSEGAVQVSAINPAGGDEPASLTPLGASLYFSALAGGNTAGAGHVQCPMGNAQTAPWQQNRGACLNFGLSFEQPPDRCSWSDTLAAQTGNQGGCFDNPPACQASNNPETCSGGCAWDFPTGLCLATYSPPFSKLYRLGAGQVSQVSDLNGFGSDDGPANLTAHGGNLYFSAKNGAGNTKLFVTDGSTITQLSDLNLEQDDAPTELYSFGGLLYFSALNPSGATKLFAYCDGLPGSACGAPGITPVGSIGNVESNDDPRLLTAYGGNLYLIAVNPFSESRNSGAPNLFRFDGNGFTQLTPFPTSGQFPALERMAVYAGKLFFLEQANGGETLVDKLFSYCDGTAGQGCGPEALVMAADLNRNSHDDPGGLITFRNALFFSALADRQFSRDGGANIRKLWRLCDTSTGCTP